jgi:hypothetical protein
LQGHLFFQKNQHLSFVKPHVIHGVCLHDVKVVWYAINYELNIGLTFHAKIINSQRYVRPILSEFFAELTDEKKLYAWLENDSAAARTAEDFVAALEEVIGDRIISRGLWSAHLLDLTPCDFCIWGIGRTKFTE